MTEISNSLAGPLSLGADVNSVKFDEDERKEGVISDLEPELKLNIPDSELITISKKWRKDWDDYYESSLKRKQDEIEKYYLGTNEKDLIADRVAGDNLIFEALETFLPIATRKVPEPVVTSDDTEEGLKLAESIKKTLIFLADTLKLKLKLKRATRYWATYYLGCIKIGWSMTTDNITLKVLRPQKLILDKDGTIDEDGYSGRYIGEIKEEDAEVLIKRFPSKKAFIEEQTQGKLGTSVKYIEWWTNEFVFWTLKDEILDKIQNPHWNYEEPQTELGTYEENLESSFEIDIPRENNVNNHFYTPKMPYIFLSVFNLGKRPHDDTSLIEQVLPLQDKINKRKNQINKNVDNINNGWVVSLQNAGLTKEQASQVVAALRAGGVAAIPSGIPKDAIDKITGNSLPADVFNDLQDSRIELRNIFGTSGSTPAGTRAEQTVRGKIITSTQDASRIGGGVTEYIEQFADDIFNWMVQMIYVYYDEEKAIPIINSDGAADMVRIKNDDIDREVLVSVKEGSLIPKDPLTQRNEAIDLWGAGALDPVTLFERLEFPNAQEAAEKLVQWKQGQIAMDEESAMRQEQAKQAGQQIPTEQPNVLGEVPLM